SGNAGLRAMLLGFAYACLFRLRRVRGIGWRLIDLFDKVQKRRGGTPYPKRSGPIPNGAPTPTLSPGLQQGDLVRIKSYREILTTLNTKHRNRGMFFDKEMVPYCEGEYRVHKRVGKIINEQTGKMQEMKTPSIILDDVFCKSKYSECRLF